MLIAFPCYNLSSDDMYTCVNICSHTSTLYNFLCTLFQIFDCLAWFRWLKFLTFPLPPSHHIKCAKRHMFRVLNIS
jgi:hypothetical protein